MIPFAAYTAADSQCAGQAPKIISSRAVEGSQPNLIHVIAPPPTASRSVQQFCKTHERDQPTNKDTNHAILRL